MHHLSIFAGIDVGSLAAKAVLVDRGRIVAKSTIATGADPQQAGKKVFEQALLLAACRPEDIAFIVGTGYGRIALPFAHRTVTEITCHGKGAYHLHSETRTVIDIGGQDSKVIRLDESGRVYDFVMNDKCAAGTGRFLEVMARALELELDELGEFFLQSGRPSLINSTCTVFAESEVISLLAQGETKQNITAGLHLAIARRVSNMAARVGIQPEVVFAGGVAKNVGLRKALEDALGIRFAQMDIDPQLMGALGAAIVAKEEYEGRGWSWI
ncbi:MAG: acyl-CoA dehydratase activase [Thermodesulfobacteriota bacterium]